MNFMKKRFVSFALFFCSVFLFAQKISVTNILGGDKRETGSGDIFNFVKVSDKNGNYIGYCTNPVISDRFQVDVKSEKIDSRIRSDMNLIWNKDFFLDFSIRGYGMCFPVEFIGFGAGNSFFQKYSLKGAWLGASDDSPKTGRLLKSGASIYGVLPLGNAGEIRGAFSVDPENWGENDSEKAVEEKSVFFNAGLEYEYPGIFSLGCVFQNIKTPAFRYGIYAGTKVFEGFFFNLGFIHNYRDYFKSRNAFMTSAGYENKDSNFGIFADFISGFDNSYLKKSGAVEHYEDSVIPLYSALRINYKLLDNLTLETNGNICLFIHDSSSMENEIYVGGKYKVSKSAGTLKGGARLSFSNFGLTGFSFPVVWKVKVSDK